MPTWTRSSARTRRPISSRSSATAPSNPLKLEIRFTTTDNNQNTAVAIQEQLRPLGIEVSLLNTDVKTH